MSPVRSPESLTMPRAAGDVGDAIATIVCSVSDMTDD